MNTNTSKKYSDQIQYKEDRKLEIEVLVVKPQTLAQLKRVWIKPSRS